MINWRRRAILYEEYMALELGVTAKDFEKWLALNHPNEIFESKYAKDENKV